MHLIVAREATILVLDKEGQLMHDGMRRFVRIGIPDHGKSFSIFMIRIARKNLINLVNRVHIKDKATTLI